MMKLKKHAVYALGVLLVLSVTAAQIGAESVGEKARDKRVEILNYLRQVRPMILNFPCEALPKCAEEAAAKKVEPSRIKAYNEIKRVYQEGLVYLFERNFINSYLRFLDSQRRLETLLEQLSQSYLDRTEIMMRDAIEKQDQDNPDDMALVDISIEYTKDSKVFRDLKYNRRAPDETRRYNPRTAHFATNKRVIERNMDMGYYLLGLARDVRMRALTVDKYLAPHQKLQPYHRKRRLEFYLGTIRLCRMAKFNAENIYQLKYPYENYRMEQMPDKRETDDDDDKNKTVADMLKSNEYSLDLVPEIEKVKMSWINNPLYLPKKLNPVFDLRLPPRYRRDAVDVRRLVYPDEVDVNIRLTRYKKKPATIFEDRNENKNVPTKEKKPQNP